jgi:nicotinamide riboside transporter PnuC
MTELLGAIAAVVAIAGVLANNRRCRVCFGLWMVSNALSAALHAQAGMVSLMARDLIFFILAVEGWRLWGRSDDQRTP